MKIGILGASGVVGRQMLECLEERNIVVSELRLFANSSCGNKIKFKDSELEIVKPDFKGLDYVLGATGKDVALKYKDDIVKSGAIFIDNSNAFRMYDDVPLVIPEINRQDLASHSGIIANPNCTTIITLMAIKGINKLSPIKGIIASSYQAVSGAGKSGLQEIEQEVKDYVYNQELHRFSETFSQPILFNCLPQIGSFDDDGYSQEEMKMENEGRKILHLPNLNVTCTCVRVPVKRSHSISLTVICEKQLNLKEVEESLKHEEGVYYMQGKEYPTPLTVSNHDYVLVGRLRYDRVIPNALALFCCGDQIRKGAATNAVEILQALEEMK